MKKINPITVFMVLAIQAIIVIYLALLFTNKSMEDQANATLLIQNEFKNDQGNVQIDDVLAKPYAWLETGSNNTAMSIAVQPVDTRERIRLEYHSPMGYHRQLLVGLDRRATNNFDIGFDAPLIEDNVEDMYWVIEKTKCVIQGVSHFDQTQTLPIGLKVSESGKIAIEVKKIENMPNPPDIYVKDLETGETHPIVNDTFEIELEPGEYNDRFVISFAPELLSIDEISLEEGFHTYVNNELSEIRIEKVMDSEVLSVDLFNYLGQRVSSWQSQLSGRDLALPVHNQSGLYILNVTTEHGILNKKIIIR